MWEIFKNEIKNGILNHPIKLIRYFGILFIPFLYGFIYIFAFFNPLEKTNQLNFTLILSKKYEPSKANKFIGDPFIKDVTSHLNKHKQKLSINIKTIYMKAEDIKNNSKELKNNIKKNYSTIIINPLYDKFNNEITITDKIIKTFINEVNLKKPSDIASKFADIILFNKNPLFDFYINYKKSFLIGFGTNVKVSTINSLKKIIKLILQTEPINLIKSISDKNNKLNPTLMTKGWKLLQDSKLLTEDTDLFINKSQMHEHAEYGFGLAPFFISLALWVGSLSTSLFIHGKVYNKKSSKIKGYFAKLFILFISNIIQTSVLFISLAIIGFSSLGINLLIMFIVSLIGAFIFSIIIHSIRLMIPNRIVGIIIVVFILIFQMGSSGGLFPTLAQSGFYKFIHYILPLSYSVDALRESMFETNTLELFKNIMILILFSIPFIIIAPIIYKNRKTKELLNEGDINVKHN
ncbi:MAG: ABC transporter permease [Mycoplasma sp.]|nr:ABC transporter permease [Mycoplasma sp.]